MGYPELGTWNDQRPTDAEDDAVEVAEMLAWTAIDHLTAGRLAFEPITVRPVVVEDDGTVRLDGPVGGVQRVAIDGFTLSLWSLDGNRLTRMDGGVWPTNDDMTLAAGAIGTFEVTYFQGWRPGRLLIWAAAQLAGEFYKAASGLKCRLPKGVTSVVRQGVSFEVSKPLFAEGQTGIHEIDVVLARYNPGRQTGQTTVTSVDSITRAPRRF